MNKHDQLKNKPSFATDGHREVQNGYLFVVEEMWEMKKLYSELLVIPRVIHILVFVQFAQKISFNLKISPNFSPMWVPFLIDFPLIASVPY